MFEALEAIEMTAALVSQQRLINNIIKTIFFLLFKIRTHTAGPSSHGDT
jgi:hypothetical protein